MTFHQAPEFIDALESTAAHFKMRSIFVEKDYWVTYALRNLALSEFKSRVVFKGGTSLSKAHDCINRFSEDIDLAIIKIDGMTDAQIKPLLKKVEGTVSAGLEYFQHPQEEKKGRNRRTFYHYTKTLKDNVFGRVKDDIQLEINSFTHPDPFEQKDVQSYVGKFLTVGKFTDLVVQYGLEPFSLNVLTRQRTMFEKLMSLIRFSYQGTDAVKGKIRHFYDIHQLMNQTDLKDQILIPENFRIIAMVKADDSAHTIFSGEWLNHPLADSPLFKNLPGSWKELEATYKSELGELIWGNLPASDDILKTLQDIKEYLAKFDSTHPAEER